MFIEPQARRCAHVPGEAFSRAVERFADQHVAA
jgi:hypothetical protein